MWTRIAFRRPLTNEENRHIFMHPKFMGLVKDNEPYYCDECEEYVSYHESKVNIEFE